MTLGPWVFFDPHIAGSVIQRMKTVTRVLDLARKDGTDPVGDLRKLKSSGYPIRQSAQCVRAYVDGTSDKTSSIHLGYRSTQSGWIILCPLRNA